MTTLLLYVQIVISLLLIVFILIQNRGTGFGRVWGSGATNFTRRGLEKVIFKLTFILTISFILISIFSLII